MEAAQSFHIEQICHLLLQKAFCVCFYTEEYNVVSGKKKKKEKDYTLFSGDKHFQAEDLCG